MADKKEVLKVEKMNLLQKISMVANEVKNIEKNIEVGKGNFKYSAVGDLDVTLAVKSAETKFGLVSIPVKQELINSEVLKKTDEKGKVSYVFVDNIKMTLKIFNLENPMESLEVQSFGKGIDSGDKGFGKASTYARKYALLNAYKIATGEDPDADKSQDINTAKELSEQTISVMNYLMDRGDLKEQVLSHFGVTRLEDLNGSQIKTLYTTYKAKKLI